MANIRLKCLDEKFIPFSELNKHIKYDKRYPEQAIQKFITLNQKTFNFLQLNAYLQEQKGETGISLVSDKYIGSAPLRSPANGKHFADIELRPRFKEQVADIVHLLQETIEPEYADAELLDNNPMMAPLYLDCLHYLNAFDKAINYTWNRFDATRINEDIPSSSTNWKRYAEHLYDPHNIFVFNNIKSIQSKNHLEWHKLTYIAQYALDLFLTPHTPASLKCKANTLIYRIKYYTSSHVMVTTHQPFMINHFDPTPIQALKTLANKLLAHHSKNNLAWRLDASILFERYVQYIMKNVAQQIGAYATCNTKIQLSGKNKPAWSLNYLEPDILLKKDDQIYFLDAKYKSHMLNEASRTNILKDTFRDDLHQILAYSSFHNSSHKISILLYPCNKYREIILTIAHEILPTQNRIALVGLPLDTQQLDSITSQLVAFFSNY